MKRILLIVVSLLSGVVAFAQSDAQFSQFNMNKLYYNPASINGKDALLKLSLTDREQWLGYGPSRPQHRMFNASYAFDKQGMGLGLTVYDYMQNVEHVLNIKVSYAYQWRIDFDSYLSFGISAGYVGRYLRTADIELPSGAQIGTTPGMIDASDVYNNLDVGLGIEFVNTNIITGIAVQHLPFAIGKDAYKATPHFYGYFTYNFLINYDWTLSPTLVVRNAIRTTNFEISLQASYSRYFYVSVGYRLDAIPVSIGVNLGKNFVLSYSCDFNIGNIRSETNKGFMRPSHEIGLFYRGMFTSLW